MFHQKVLIIGAGASGIAAASRLVANDVLNFIILEAEDRIGGRILSTDVGNRTLDLGAQWVHGEVHNICHSLGSAAGLLGNKSYDVHKSKVILSDGSCLDEKIASQLHLLSHELLHDEQRLSKFSGSLGDYFNKSLKEQLGNNRVLQHVDANTLESFLKWLHMFQNSIDGSDSWFQTSARGTVEYHVCEGNPLTYWKSGGYASVLNLLMGSNSNTIKEKISFNKSVMRILWDKQPVEVLCTDGQKYSADHVILTVSLGVLKENISSLFKPSLPHKKLLAIQGLGIGTVDKMFLTFPYRWWPDDCSGFNLLWKKSDVLDKHGADPSWLEEVFMFNSVDNNPLVLCGWVVGSAARHMEQCSDTQVLEGCYKLLLKFLGSSHKIPAPVNLIRSKWQSNPHFRGSYSFRSLTSDKYNVCAADLASPLRLLSGHPVVLFAGEATHGHFYSTVHGAIETGWREADRLVSHLSSLGNRLPKASL